MNVFVGEMECFKKFNFIVVFLGINKECIQRLLFVLVDYEIEVVMIDSKKVFVQGQVYIMEGEF